MTPYVADLMGQTLGAVLRYWQPTVEMTAKLYRFEVHDFTIFNSEQASNCGQYRKRK